MDNHDWRGVQVMWCPQGKSACIMRDWEGALGEKVGDLLWFGGCGTSNCRRLGRKSLGGQEPGQRQGGPGHGGKNGPLAKGWLDYLLLGY